jgi:hemerythrin
LNNIISWEEKYSVGIAKIDEQHQKLFNYLNDYYESIASGKSSETISLTLKNLIDYASYHFKDEEDWMSTIPGYDASEHVAEHKYFISKVVELLNKNISGHDIKFDLFDFMKEWVLNHILVTDKKIEKSNLQ